MGNTAQLNWRITECTVHALSRRFLLLTQMRRCMSLVAHGCLCEAWERMTWTRMRGLWVFSTAAGHVLHESQLCPQVQLFALHQTGSTQVMHWNGHHLGCCVCIKNIFCVVCLEAFFFCLKATSIFLPGEGGLFSYFCIIISSMI